MIEFQNVKKSFPDGTEAIKGINVTIPKGQLVALIGPSGCGKTTTMKMINKLLLPTSGNILIDGKDISHINEVELRRNIGYVIQRIGLFPHMTIEDNIALIPKLKGWSPEKYQKKVDELMNLVGLDPKVFRKRYPLELSGGQQQRVGVIRALAAEPPIILMDEPFSALDPISREQLQDELKNLQRSIQKTIVFVTHDIDEALKIADKIVIMKEGLVQQMATPLDLVQNPENEFVRSFIGEHRLQENVEDYKVSDILIATDEYHTNRTFSNVVSHDSSVEEVSYFMLNNQLSEVGVEKSGEIIGLLTKDDLLRAFLSKKKGETA